MNPQDPFDPAQDPDKTMLIPTPGGRRSGPAPVQAPPSSPAPAMPISNLPGSGLNQLVRAANPLLDLVLPLRLTTQPPDLQQLRERLVGAVKTFEQDARAGGIAPETIAAARYILCTMLDETISGTAWGSGVWGTRSLLVAFHNEASGGEKVFLILQRLSQDVKANIDLLELFYLCLSLGLEGRYRVFEQGQSQLTVLRERLFNMIRTARGPYEPTLSPDWRGGTVPVESPAGGMLLWVLLAAACVLLLLFQLFTGFVLNNASDPVYASLSGVKVAAAGPAVTPVAAPVVTAPRVAGFLAQEIAQGLVSVRETAGSSVITLHGDGMFPAGSAEVQDNMAPLLARIGDALAPLQGKVVVIGHTDDTKPGLSARFPSNYALSKSRAAAVMAILSERAGPAERYNAEGRGDTDPMVANDSVRNRARNRRVDIAFFPLAQI